MPPFFEVQPRNLFFLSKLSQVTYIEESEHIEDEV
ncbi:hypothetical protein ABIE27_002428 [Paenibacillus sp. 4624]|jgi:hypothetical protein